jgi:hypothetical protein
VGAKVRKITCAAEYIGVALASVKNNALIKNSNSLKFLSATVSDTSLENELYVKADIYRIEAFVELYGIKADMSLGYTSALNSYSTGVFHYFFSVIRQEHLDVFKTVAISARVKNPARFYTNSFLAYAGAA